MTKKDYRHVFHLYVLKNSSRDKLKKNLEDVGIPTGIHYPKALPFLEAYKYLNHKISEFPIAHKATKEILSIPIYPELDDKQAKYIAHTLNSF